MAIVSGEGVMPKRVGQHLIYKLSDVFVMRRVSGYTRALVMDDPRYFRTRCNKSEFGQMVSQCKQWRDSLAGILPKKYFGTTMVNALHKKMHQVLLCDRYSVYGERHLAAGLGSEEGRAALTGYDCNPEAGLDLDFTLLSGQLRMQAAGLLFPEEANRVGFRVHRLAYDFGNGVHTLVSGRLGFYSRKGLGAALALTVPELKGDGVLFTLLEVQFFRFTEGSYLPLPDDRSKGVIVVGVAC